MAVTALSPQLMDVPSQSSVLARARLDRTKSTAPMVRANALQSDADRQLTDAVMQEFRTGGLFKLYQPRMFGGDELPYGHLQLAISSELGAMSGSAAWVHSVLGVHSWMLGGFPRSAQTAVWGGSRADALIATSGASSEFRCATVKGGMEIGGRWHFSSGSKFSDWFLLRSAVPKATRSDPGMWFLLPKSDVQIIDVWDAAGLKGTGSNDLVLDRVFVPSEFIVDASCFRGDDGDSISPHDTFLYRLPYAGVFTFAIAAPAIGVAKGALRQVKSEPTDRGSDVVRHMRVSAATAEVECAEMLLGSNAAMFERMVADRQYLTAGDRATMKRNAAFAVKLCLGAVERLVEGVGARGIGATHPVRRSLNDLLAISSHAGLSWERCADEYGRSFFALPSKDALV